MSGWLKRSFSRMRERMGRLVGRARPRTSEGSGDSALRTVILSDLHLGTGKGVYDIFAGEDALAAFLDRQAARPTRIILNGDAFDFLMNDDGLTLDAGLAAAQAQTLVANPVTAEVLAALGRILAAGGEVVVRTGNHDLELALGEVQQVLRGALRQPEATAQRLRFERGDQPQVLDVGGARVLVTHGEHSDAWNKIDFEHLPGPGSAPAARPADFTYPSGSMLVKQLINPLKSQYGMRFVGLLSPEFQGSVLTALAVEPAIVKLAFQQSTLDIGWQLWRSVLSPSSFGPEGEPNLGLAEALDQLGLTEQERLVLQSAGEVSFSEEPPELLQVRVKLARGALTAYARAHRVLAGPAAAEAFRLEALPAEVQEARRLASKFGADAVILGHTHRARWHEEEGLLFANTGTWAWRMRLPSPEEPDAVWADFLWALKQNPGLELGRSPSVPRMRRLTAVLAEPHAEGGASVSLVEWDATAKEERVLGAARMRPRRAA